jgi:virginiamycin B lyase
MPNDNPLNKDVAMEQDHIRPRLRRGQAIAAIIVLDAALLLAGPEAKAQPAYSLIGHVSSALEGQMEGVIVSAKKLGSTITVSVVTNVNGAYRFPADRLGEGRYELTIRASGYGIDVAKQVQLVSNKPTEADITLTPAPVTPEEVTNAEWLASAPGPDDLKRQLLNCTDCHTIQRIFQSSHTADEFLKVFERMAGYYPGASDMQPQRLLGNDRRPPLPAGMEKQVADYLASVNLNGRATHPFEIKTFPRPTGRATNVVITEFDLPRPEIQPHDVIVDRNGMAWFGHFAEQYLTRLDPRTGEVKDFPIPVQRPGSPKGTLDVEFDQQGNIWVGLMYQTGIARFDPLTETFRIYPLPKEWLRDNTQQSHFSIAGAAADGKVWVKDSNRSQVLRLDIASGQYENLGSLQVPETKQPIGIYGIYADLQNNAYALEFPFGGIGKVDAKGGPFKFVPTPTPNSRARRGRVDAQNRLWFAEYGSNGIGMFDPVSEKITEWRMTLPWEAPYDVIADSKGEVWEVNETSDRVGRLNPATGEIVEYLLPKTGVNGRRVFVDDKSGHTAVWFGSNHGASLIKVEPLD